MTDLPNIAIIGCGYVGLTTAAILSNAGFTVTAVEVNPERLRAIQGGKSFFYEAGIDPLIQSGLASGRLSITNSLEQALANISIVFSCVGTPDNPDGSSNLSYVFDVAQQAAGLLRDDTNFVQKSTVPVGTGEQIEELFRATGKTIRYVSNPEFLREGTAISDTLWFDRIVVGSSDIEAAESVMDLYRAIEKQRDSIAEIAQLDAPKSIPTSQYFSVGRNSAELTKVTANAFLALKISFANSIAKLADQADADVVEVMDAVGADRRIGRAFLNAGRGYGGGCFPKDVSGLIRSAEDYGVAMEIMQAATEVNESMPHYIIHKAQTALGESFEGKRVAILGLAFKAGTSDTRRSPAVAIANTLARQHAQVRAYDPEANAEAQHDLHETVELCDNLETVLKDTECVFVATDWPEFTTDTFIKKLENSNIKILVDCMNRLPPESVQNLSSKYIGVGVEKSSLSTH